MSHSSNHQANDVFPEAGVYDSIDFIGNAIGGQLIVACVAYAGEFFEHWMTSDARISTDRVTQLHVDLSTLATLAKSESLNTSRDSQLFFIETMAGITSERIKKALRVRPGTQRDERERLEHLREALIRDWGLFVQIIKPRAEHLFAEIQ